MLSLTVEDMGRGRLEEGELRSCRSWVPLESMRSQVVVCIVSDGRLKINSRTLSVLAAMGIYQEGVAKNAGALASSFSVETASSSAQSMASRSLRIFTNTRRRVSLLLSLS